MNFNFYSKYYDLLYKDKDTESECDYIIERIEEYGGNSNDILELGAGSGRHGQIFKKKGISWKGLELSSEMIEIAQIKDCKIDHGDIEFFSYETQFDTIISLFHVISYITENGKLINTFKNISKHLNHGGLLLFDVWYSPAVYHLYPEKRTKIIENDELKIIRQAIPSSFVNKNIVEVNYKITVQEKNGSRENRFTEVHPMRHFSLPELKLIAEFAGFDFLNCEEWLTGKKPSEETWGVLVILRKNS